MVLKMFVNDNTKKVAKYTNFISQALKCLKKVKNTLD